eukprot:3596811-Amphidinium_carterae.1
MAFIIGSIWGLGSAFSRVVGFGAWSWWASVYVAYTLLMAVSAVHTLPEQQLNPEVACEAKDPCSSPRVNSETNKH